MIQSLHASSSARIPTRSSASRRASTRIAKGSGQPEQQVQELVQKFLFMKQMMEGLGQNMGMLGQDPGHEEPRDGQAAAQADGAGRRRRDARAWAASRGCRAWGCRGWGCPGWAFPGMGMPGMGMPGWPGRREHDQDEAAVGGGEEREEGAAQAREGSAARAAKEPPVRAALTARRVTRRAGSV